MSIETIIKLHEDGLCVLPTRSEEGKEKAPFSKWKHYQTKRPTYEEISNWSYPTGFGIVCGEVSNNLFVFDFDNEAKKKGLDDEEFNTMMSDFDINMSDLMPDIYDKFEVVETRNGWHWYVRCEYKVPPNTVFAKKEGQFTIESRGEGGFIKYYAEDVVNIPTLSSSELDRIIEFCKAFNVDYKIDDYKKAVFREDNSGGIVEHINTTKDGLDRAKKALLDAGWTHAYRDAYVRPDKNVKDGISGQFYESGLFKVFTTADPNIPEGCYRPFSVICKAEFNDDPRETAKSLGKEFGIFKANVSNEVVNKRNFAMEIAESLGIDEITDYIKEQHTKTNIPPLFTIGAMYYAISAAVGNKTLVEDAWGSKKATVLFIALMGHTSDGKTPSINAIIKRLKIINQKLIDEHYKASKQYQKDMEDYSNTPKAERGQKPIEPNLKEFLIQKPTAEGLIAALQDNKGGVSVHIDELSGYFATKKKFAGVGNEKSAIADSVLAHYDADPIGRRTKNLADSSYAENGACSIIGGLQPKIAGQYFDSHMINSGGLGRMTCIYPESKSGNSFYKQRARLDKWGDALQSLYDNYHEKGDVIQMSNEARMLWEQTYTNIETMDVSDNERASLRKTTERIVRIAALTYLIKYAYGIYDVRTLEITKEDLETALLFWEMEQASMKKLSKELGESESTTVEKKVSKASVIADIVEVMPKLAKTKIAEMLGVDNSYVHKVLRKKKL